MRHCCDAFFCGKSKTFRLNPFDDGNPAVFIGLGAILNATELVVQFEAPRAGLAVAELVGLAVLGVVDARDGADDGSSAASASLFEGGQFLFGDGTTFDLHAEGLSQLHQALVGDGRQDGRALWRDIGVVLDAEEVGSASLVDVLLLLGVEIELAGILTTVASLDVRTQRSGIVATDLVGTGAQRGSAVVLTRDDVGVSHEAALEVRTDGGHEDNKQILVSGFHTHAGTRANEQRTQIQRSASLVWRDEIGIQADNFLNGFLELVHRELSHHDATARALQTFAVLVHAEDAHLAVLATESFQTFECFLTIMQAGSGHVDVD